MGTNFHNTTIAEIMENVSFAALGKLYYSHHDSAPGTEILANLCMKS